MNGPGRSTLAQAVQTHRIRRIGSRDAMSKLGGLSAGTIKNVELTDRDLSARTLDAIDDVLGWEAGTARDILVNDASAPTLPAGRDSHPVSRLPRRLLVEYDGQEVYEVRGVDVRGHDARIVLTLVGSPGLDLAAIRAGLHELDAVERKLRGEE